MEYDYLEIENEIGQYEKEWMDEHNCDCEIEEHTNER